MDYTDLQLKGINANTVSVSDYSIVVPNKVARVIISFTGSPKKRDITASLVKKFKGMAAPIDGSFFLLSNNSAVGFVRAVKQVKMTDEREIRSSYKVLSKNILVSNEDESMWEVKKGVGSLYLARHGQEDLSEVIQSVVSNNTDAPKFGMVACVAPKKSELVAYVTNKGDMDYGFAVNTTAKKVQLVSKSSRTSVVVPVSQVVASYEVVLPEKLQKAMRKAVITAGLDDRGIKDNMIEYYKQLYGYDPQYVDELVEQIEELTFA